MWLRDRRMSHDGARLRGLALAVVCLTLSGCALFERSASCVTRQLMPPAALDVSSAADSPEFCVFHGRLAAWYVPYAIMSLNAYRPAGLDAAAADAAVSCHDGDDKVLCPVVWRESRKEHLLEKDNDATGLFMEAFERIVDHDGKEFVIAFRGTEFTRLNDWRANLRWLMPGFRETDQYPRARRTAVQWVARACQGIGNAFQRLDVVMTGHSLGGGLAQGAAYAVGRALYPKLVPPDGTLGQEEQDAQARLTGCPQAKVRVRAIVFDPSPVTGYRDGQPLAECENPQSERCRSPIVMRVYERGEILAGPRRILSWFNPLPPNICEDRYDLDRSHGLPVTQHQMRRIAGGLLWLAKEAEGGDAKEIYDRYCPPDGGVGTGRLVCIPRKYECPSG
jgi:hypothetical protein